MNKECPSCIEKKFSSSQIAKITNGRLLGNKELSFFYCYVDSREVVQDSLFVALAGEKSDGHLFLLDASKNGATIFMVEKSRLSSKVANALVDLGKAIVVVEDCLTALHQIAKAHLEKFPHLIKIGITGSSGKTTTKEIVASILSVKYNTFKTQGNYNSEIGLPLMVLCIESYHQVAVLEMGIDHIGEMERLVGIFNPHYALITSIGTAHIGRFGSQEKLAQEKGKIFSSFNDKCFAVINQNDELAIKEKGNYLGTSILYGVQEVAKGGYEIGSISAVDKGLLGWELSSKDKSKSVLFTLVGKHNILNFAGCYEIAKLLSLDDDDILRGVSTIKPLFGRAAIKPFCNDIILIEDCYNANGESTMATIEFFDNLAVKRRKILLLGAMKELGAMSKDIHESVGRILERSSIDTIFLIGEETLSIYNILNSRLSYKGKFFYFEERQKLFACVGEYKRPGDLWLFKGSRSMALEEFEGALESEVEC